MCARDICAVIVLAGTAAACTSPESIRVTVRAQTTDAPVEGATVAWVCTPFGTGAARTDATGVATVTVFEGDPETCVLTVAKLGFRTQQLVDLELASRDIVLEPSP